jgi:hypothetical protein
LDDGETVEITVEYFSSTPGYLKQRMLEAMKADEEYQKKLEEAEKKGKTLPPRFVYATDEMVRDIFALRDPDGELFADEKGKPMKITVENLDKLDQRNLNAIRTAITEDISGKKSQPAG